MQRISVNGIQLNVFDQGSGRPILFVHGFPLNHAMWQWQFDALPDSYRVIAPDLRGFGQSDTTAGIVTMEQFADDLAALLDALDVEEPVTLCGLSMGGYVAWQFLRRHQARLRSLILCDTKAMADTPEGVAGRHELAERVLKEGAEAAADAVLAKLLSPATYDQRPELVESVSAMILDSSREGIAAALRGMAARSAAFDLLPQITVPTLVLVGADDQISPPDEMQQIAASIPGAEFVQIPDSGHLAPMENPHAANESLKRFLSEH